MKERKISTIKICPTFNRFPSAIQEYLDINGHSKLSTNTTYRDLLGN